MNNALPAGTSLQNGAFVLDEVIGRGGSGFTYAARDTVLQRKVAIKEFFPANCTRLHNSVRQSNFANYNDFEYSNALADFAAEARVLARFAHPNIVQVFAVFEENDTAYLVTEFLDGQTLQEIVEARGILPQSEALDLIAPVCDAMEAVHRGGVLHGDIKPQNIIRCFNGRVVLLDFGLTRPTSTGTFVTTLLVPHNAAGTAGYAPLEQYSRAARTGTWSDVYALAATLWHLLAGNPPPDAPDRASGTRLPDLQRFNSTISDETMHILHQALAMDALARPQNADEFRQLLQNRRVTMPISADNRDSSTRLTERFSVPQSEDWLSTRPSSNDENAVAMLVILCIVLVLAFLFVMLPRFF